MNEIKKSEILGEIKKIEGELPWAGIENYTNESFDRDTLFETLMSNVSCLFYEFEDLEVKDENNKTKRYNPLFNSSVLNNPLNQRILTFIADTVPFYYKDPQITIKSTEDPILTSTRDCGKNGVPTPLYTDFWETWLEESWGDIQNLVILDVFNKLGNSFINENTYLNANIFPKLSENLINSISEGGTYDYTNLIDFVDTEDENKVDDYNSIKGVSYLNEIVEEKLQSMYSLIDYNPDQSKLLDKWTESLYWSGKLNSLEIESEKEVYKLQDIKYELLRRKFAGSSTLYNLSLASINRKGSFVSTIRIGDLNTSTSIFKDKRILRILSLPGVMSSVTKKEEIDPIKTFYTNPTESGVGNPIPIDIIIPLYYSSASTKIGDTTEKTPYSANVYYVNSKRYYYLRDNVLAIDLDELRTITSSESIATYNYALDDKQETSAEGGSAGSYRELDGVAITIEGSVDSEDRTEVYHRLTLDYGQKLFDMKSVSGSCLDITANRLLYHSNTLQTNMGTAYPYLTYPIANGNSISLIDQEWIEYIKNSTDRKSRVQDKIDFGVQVSKYAEIEGTQTFDYYVFTATYSDTFDYNIEDTYYSIEDYEKSHSTLPKYMLLWYVTLKIDVKTFKVASVNKLLMSRVTLKICEETGYSGLDGNTFNIDSYKDLRKCSMGVLPFTYSELSSSTKSGTKNLFSYKLGIENNSFVNSFNDESYSLAYFVFVDNDFIPKNYLNDRSTSPDTLNSNVFSSLPSNNTRTVYYAVKREESYYYSDPIKLVPANSIFSKEGSSENVIIIDKEFFPEWKEMALYINPYLNFTSNSASPLRNKETIVSYRTAVDKSLDPNVEITSSTTKSDLKKKTFIISGPSESTYLSNMIRFRGMDYLSNDLGTTSSPWTPKYRSGVPTGIYLNRVVNRVYSNNIEYAPIEIYGDNRRYDANYKKPTSSLLGVNTGYDIYKDSNLNPCIHIQKRDDSETFNNLTKERLNFFQLAPIRMNIDSTCDTTIWNNWIWNKNTPTKGFTFYLHLLFNSKDLEVKCYLIKSENFELLLKTDTNEKTSKLVFKYGSTELSYSKNLFNDIEKGVSLRIGVTVVPNKHIAVCVNNYSSESVEFSLTTLNTLTKPIDLFSNVTKNDDNTYNQENNFFGDVYDIRVYTTGVSKEQLSILNMGSMRELFSYSPSTYKLGYSIYNDLSAIKRCDIETVSGSESKKLNVIRLFNRSIWDSILLDMYPMSEEESDPKEYQYNEHYWDNLYDTDVYKIIEYDDNDRIVDTEFNDCIQQELCDGVETLASDSLGASSISSNGRTYSVDSGNKLNLVTTTLYPLKYKNTVFNSYGTRNNLEINFDRSNNYLSVDKERGISIPINQTGNTLQYSTDVNFNFRSYLKSDLSLPYSKGSSINIVYNTILEKSVASLNSDAKRVSNENHILIPFSIPYRENEEIDSRTCDAYLCNFELSDVQLNSSFNTLLNSESYYNELRVPIAIRESIESDPIYISKWNGIRVLREGTYYITCKYPIQILPFFDYNFDTSSYSNFNVFYGSVRFKIEVKGTPIEYNSNEFGLKGYPNKYLESSYKATLGGDQGLFHPEDNRTYPHRQIDIDLYVMDTKSGVPGRLENNKEDYTFTWKLIGSNHVVKDGVISLSKINTNGESLNIKGIKFPMYLSKNYTSSFFLAETERTSEGHIYNPLSCDDDLIDPIRLFSTYTEENLSLENLTVSTEEDLDDISLVSGNSYKLLFDFDAKVTEVSFTDSYFEEDINNGIKNEEKVNYSRLTSLIDSYSNEISDYMYDGFSDWYNLSSTFLTNGTSGFETSENSWKSIESSSGNNNYFGNPYSRSSNKNFLLKEMDSRYRQNIEYSYSFPYVPTEVPSDMKFSCKYTSKVDLISGYNNSYSLTLGVPFNEVSYVERAYNSIRNKVMESIGNIKSDICGVFSQISTISPVYSSSVSNNYDTINYLDFNLYGYHASDRVVPSKNENITITRNGCYSNNLITNQNLSDKTKWFTSVGCSYVPYDNWDNGLGKDIASFTLTPNLSVYHNGEKINNFEVVKNKPSDEDALLNVYYFELGSSQYSISKVYKYNPIGNKSENSISIVNKITDIKDNGGYQLLETIENYSATKNDYVVGDNTKTYLAEEGVDYYKKNVDLTYTKVENITVGTTDVKEYYINVNSNTSNPIYIRVGQEVNLDIVIPNINITDVSNISIPESTCTYSLYYNGKQLSMDNIVFTDDENNIPSSANEDKVYILYTKNGNKYKTASRIFTYSGSVGEEDDTSVTVSTNPSEIVIDTGFFIRLEDSVLTLRYLPPSDGVTHTAKTEVAINVCMKENEESKFGEKELNDISGLKVSSRLLEIGTSGLIKNSKEMNLTVDGISQTNEDISKLEDNKFYIYSEETSEEVTSNSIEFNFKFKCLMPKTLLVTKVVARRSYTLSHKLGFCDALYSNSISNREVILSNHDIVIFKNRKLGYPIPVTFGNIIKKRNASRDYSKEVEYVDSFQKNVKRFIENNSLGYLSSNNKIEKLIAPWVRRLHYSQDSGKYDEKGNPIPSVIFYNYGVSEDEFGNRVKRENSITNDIFDDVGDWKYDESSMNVYFSKLHLNTNNNSGLFGGYNIDLSLEETSPIVFTYEKFSLLANCFNPNRFLEGLESVVSVTNIQLLKFVKDSNTDEEKLSVKYELEYPPIIYDETKSHLSLNLLFKF